MFANFEETGQWVLDHARDHGLNSDTDIAL